MTLSFLVSMKVMDRPSSRSRKDLSGIENVLRIERAFQRPHQGDLGLVSRPCEIIAFFQADAVFGRHRAATLAQGAVNHILDRVARLAASVADAGNQMEISIS